MWPCYALGMPRDDEYLTPQELARELKLSPRTLQRWRTEGTGPPWHKVGRRVRYLWREVKDWMRAEGYSPDGE